MYPPPKTEIIEKLQQIDLESICYGLCTVSLSFHNGNGLSFSAPFRFGKNELFPEVPASDFPLSDSQLVRLLGCQITQLDCDVDGTLELNFSNGDLLIVYANDPMYEAYTLRIDGKEYIV